MIESIISYSVPPISRYVFRDLENHSFRLTCIIGNIRYGTLSLAALFIVLILHLARSQESALRVRCKHSVSSLQMHKRQPSSIQPQCSLGC